MTDASTSSNLVSRLRQRLITVPKPDTKPFDMPAAGYFQMGSVGGTHKPGDSAGVLSVFSTCVSVGNKLQEHIYAVDPLCEEAAQALERTPSETSEPPVFRSGRVCNCREYPRWAEECSKCLFERPAVEPKAPRDAEDALLEIERHSRRIEILCDYFKFDPAEFLAEGRAENGNGFNNQEKNDG